MLIGGLAQLVRIWVSCNFVIQDNVFCFYSALPTLNVECSMRSYFEIVSDGQKSPTA